MLALLIAGIGIISYPHVMQILYRQYARNMISDFEEGLEIYRATNEEGSLRMLNLQMMEHNQQLYAEKAEDNQQSYTYNVGGNQQFYTDNVEDNQQLYADRQHNGSYCQIDFGLQQFGFAEDMIGFIEIPKMGVKLPILSGATEENMRRGAVHLPQTSLPVGGINTNAVIAAHRGMSTAVMFRDIEMLEMGDVIIITNFYQTLIYAVVETRVILPTQVDAVMIQSGRDLVTLSTCHPYRHNHQRYLVFGERVLN